MGVWTRQCVVGPLCNVAHVPVYISADRRPVIGLALPCAICVRLVDRAVLAWVMHARTPASHTKVRADGRLDRDSVSRY